MEVTFGVKDAAPSEIETGDFPKYKLLNEAAYQAIKLLRPDLLNESLGVLFEEYEGDLKKILAEYIN